MKYPPWFPGPAQNLDDYGSSYGAQILADRIRKLWHKCGHPQVMAWVDRRDGVQPSEGSRFDVRTNLVSGLPPPKEEA